MKGFTNKQPKIVAASVLVLNRALQWVDNFNGSLSEYVLYCPLPPHREFGAKVINVKMLMKAVPPLFEHSDKNVRAEVGIVHEHIKHIE